MSRMFSAGDWGHNQRFGPALVDPRGGNQPRGPARRTGRVLVFLATTVRRLCQRTVWPVRRALAPEPSPSVSNTFGVQAPEISSSGLRVEPLSRKPGIESGGLSFRRAAGTTQPEPVPPRAEPILHRKHARIGRRSDVDLQQQTVVGAAGIPDYQLSASFPDGIPKAVLLARKVRPPKQFGPFPQVALPLPIHDHDFQSRQ
jgi:hypothetical protein